MDTVMKSGKKKNGINFLFFLKSMAWSNLKTPNSLDFWRILALIKSLSVVSIVDNWIVFSNLSLISGKESPINCAAVWSEITLRIPKRKREGLIIKKNKTYKQVDKKKKKSVALKNWFKWPKYSVVDTKRKVINKIERPKSRPRINWFW